MSTMSEITPTTTALAKYEPAEAKLAELRKTYAATVWQIDSASSLEAARKARAAIREERLLVKEIHDALKRPLLDAGAAVEERFKYLTAEIRKLEDPVDHAIKAEETHKEAEKQARIQAENLRVEKARAEIEDIRAAAHVFVGASSCVLVDAIQKLQGRDVKRLDEFGAAAETARVETLAKLEELHRAALSQEAEQARIVAERAELAKLRAEQERRQQEADDKARAESERIAGEQTAARARIRQQELEAQACIDAERKIAAANLAKEREAIEAENRTARAKREHDDAVAQELRAQMDEAARQERLKEQARLDVKRQKDAAEQKAKDEERQKADEEAAIVEREIQRKQRERMDAREVLTTFRERYGMLSEFAGIANAIDQYFAAREQRAA